MVGCRRQPDHEGIGGSVELVPEPGEVVNDPASRNRIMQATLSPTSGGVTGGMGRRCRQR
jgi:hypothetical protein